MGLNAPTVESRTTLLLLVLKKNGYPDWWYDLQAKKKKNSGGAETNTGTVAAMSAEPHLSLVPQVNPLNADPVSDIGKIGSGFATSSSDGNRNTWLLDSAATDHMTFDATDFTTRSTPRRTCVENANGGSLFGYRSGHCVLIPVSATITYITYSITVT